MNRFEPSWYVENLLVNSSSIREAIDGIQFLDEEFFDEVDLMEVYEKVETGIDSQLIGSYDDLLTVEQKIKELVDNNLIPPRELVVVNLILDNNTFSDINDKNLMTRFTAARSFRKFCARVAYYLGGKFPNSGYIEYMTDKYKLNQNEVKKLEEHIISNRRFK